MENIRRIAEVAKLMLDAGLVVMTTFISPFRQEREMARELIGPENFVEVFVNTQLAVCEQGDAKGLYKKARAGLLPNMTGIGNPYEAPQHPEVVLDCGRLSSRAAVKIRIGALNIRICAVAANLRERPRIDAAARVACASAAAAIFAPLRARCAKRRL